MIRVISSFRYVARKSLTSEKYVLLDTRYHQRICVGDEWTDTDAFELGGHLMATYETQERCLEAARLLNIHHKTHDRVWINSDGRIKKTCKAK